MDMFIVHKGRPLAGAVHVSGAKNSALPIMAASLLADGPSELTNVPRLQDVLTLQRVINGLGVTSSWQDDGSLVVEPDHSGSCIADYDLVRRMRASVCVLGPLLARRGRACVSLPGGCNIGDRPIDLHLKGLRALGADVAVERGYVVAQATRLRGARIYLGGPFGSTVTGTCNVMAAASLAEGTTSIDAAACEPEVVDLGNYLNAMGAQITGLGTPFLAIEGVERLTGVRHEVIPDRIEAATWMIAAAISRGTIDIHHVREDHLSAVIEKLKEIGVIMTPIESGMRVAANTELQSSDCIALPYPGLPTDIQAQLMALLSTIPGISVVTDKVFPDRFLHAAELVRMGAQIRREGPSAIINGTDRLSGANVMASDLRASAALVLAGLAADGETAVRRIYHLDRGYEDLDEKLRRLGAHVSRTRDEPENLPASLTQPDASHAPIPSPHFERSAVPAKRSTR